MENEIKIGEQPLNLDKTQEEMKVGIDNGGQIQEENGSQLGKFNSPESLLEAYNNLQREFTKKCQKHLQNKTPILKKLWKILNYIIFFLSFFQFLQLFLVKKQEKNAVKEKTCC